MRETHTLRFRGLMLEKFLDKALETGVRFGDVKRTGGREAMLTTDEKGGKRLLALAAEYRLDVILTRVDGAAALRRALRRRAALVVALLTCAAALCLASQRIWVIDAPDDARALLRDMGVAAGVPRDGVDTRRAETHLLANLEGYSFIGVRVRGVVLSVRTEPLAEEPEIYDVRGARDLVAARDGVIVSVNVLTGEAAVKKGDTVKKGQLLIRGEEQATDETTRGARALGTVTARVWVSGEARALLYETVSQKTGRFVTESEVTAPGRVWPLTRARPFACETTEEEYMPIGGLFLPVMIRRVTHYETLVSQKARDASAVRGETGALALENAAALLPNPCEMIDKWVDYSMIERDTVRARATIECRTDIAVPRDALNTGGS